MNDSTPVAHGYTLADLDRMARVACAADRSLAGDMTTRYDTAWSAIALALVEAERWPRPETLVRAGWQAIYRDVREVQHLYGVTRNGHTGAVASAQRFCQYWSGQTFTTEAAYAERVTEILAVRQIVPALTPALRDAALAVIVHPTYEAAAKALGIGYGTLIMRLSDLRKQFGGLWFAPETVPLAKAKFHRDAVRTKPARTHCRSRHELIPENVYTRADGVRICRTCEAARSARRHATRMAVAA